MSTGRFVHGPGLVLHAAAVLSATAAAVLAGSTSTVALTVAAVGLVGVVAGVARDDRRTAALGALALLASVVIAGVAAAPPEVLLPATAAALLAWDFGTGAFVARDELVGGAVERTEVVQVAAATGVGVVATGAAYGMYQTLSVGVSFAGVMLLLIAAAALGLALRE